MKKIKKVYRYIFIILLIVLLITMAMKNNQTSNENELNPSTSYNKKTFNERGIYFNYPEFVSWKVDRITNEEEGTWTIHLTPPEDIVFDDPPKIVIKKVGEQKIMNFERVSGVNTIKHTVPKGDKEVTFTKGDYWYEFIYYPEDYDEGYDPKNNWDGLHLRSKTEPIGATMKFDIYNTHSFSKETFADMVIDSFRLE